MPFGLYGREASTYVQDLWSKGRCAVLEQFFQLPATKVRQRYNTGGNVRISLFDRKDLFSMNHSRLFAILLFILLATFQGGPARAGSYYYFGPSFDASECAALGVTNCAPGAVTGIMYAPVSSSFSGVITSVPSWSLFALGNFINPGTTSTPPSSSVTQFSFASGQISGWIFAGASIQTSPIVQIQTVDVGYDQAALYDTTTGATLAYGIVETPPHPPGFWLSPAALGAPCAAEAPSDAPPVSGKSSCGDPVDVGSGNLFESAQDYSTVGQNPLAFTRYYNSMSVPD
jgi:hypothetical protein